MTLLDRLERRLSRFAVPNATLGIIFGQVVLYAAREAELRGAIRGPVVERLTLVPKAVLEGEWWRLFTFAYTPPCQSLLWVIVFWYFFYFVGNVLEHTWGTFRYNVYLLVGYVATVAAAFLAPDQTASVAFLQGSVFLAFAYLYPDFVIQLAFVLPVRAKWLAWIAWASYGMMFLSGNLVIMAMVGASVANFFVFFGRDVLARVVTGHRLMRRQASRMVAERKPRHVCAVCGASNKTHPGMDFRYCSKCGGQRCYCQEHLHNHEHVAEEGQQHATW